MYFKLKNIQAAWQNMKTEIQTHDAQLRNIAPYFPFPSPESCKFRTDLLENKRGKVRLAAQQKFNLMRWYRYFNKAETNKLSGVRLQKRCYS